MPDAGEIKAKVTIEYDGSGIEKAKEDLASLGEIGSGVQAGAENASAGLATLDEQAAKSAERTKSLNAVLEELPKAFDGGEASIASFSETLAAQPDVIASTTQALKDMQDPLKSYTENLQVASEAFDPQTFGLNDFAENMAVFQDAMVNPEPFAVIGQHLRETGQTWQDFTSSIGDENVAIAHEMAASAGITGDHLDMLGAQVQSINTVFQDSAGATEEFTKQFNGLNESVVSTGKAINQFGGVGAGMYGPFQKIMEPIGFGEAFGNATEGIMGALNDVAMPLMALQMIGMVVQQAGQAIYDAAAIAEGPAAHGVGTFTGTVDALGQSIQKVGAQFSESFGQGILPTLNAINYQTSQAQGAGGIGGGLGMALSTLFNIAQIGTGFNPVGGFEGLVNQGAAALGFQQPFQGPGPSSQTAYDVVSVVHQQTMQTQQNVQTLLEYASDPTYLQQQDQLSAAQQIYQRAQQRYNIQHPINQQQMLMGFQEQQYDAQQAQNYAYQMQNPTYGPYDPIGYWSKPDSFLDLIGPKVDASGIRGFFGGIGSGISNWWNSLWKSGDSTGLTAGASESLPSLCFVAGTRVLMADGSKKPIETLQIGEQVLAHDGEKQVITPILARIVPLPRRVYKLTFDDGRVLTLTNSHPLSTEQGWKSLSPEASKQTNPDLSVTKLEVGDRVHITDGTCVLTSILPLQGTRQIYNITVDDPHTFYAGGVLVHNKVLSSNIGPQISEQIGDIQLPHIDLSGMSSQLSGQFGGITIPHLDLSGLTAGLSSMFSGISLPAIPNIGSQISGELGSMFSGISMPSIPDLGNMINGAMSSMFGGIALPAMPDIGAMISGAMTGMFGGISLPSVPEVGAMLSGAMTGMFGGLHVPSVPNVGAMITGAMSGMFGGITIPSPPNLGAQISSAMSGMFSGISLPSVPFFARGVQNYTGLGIVGEEGPELVSLNGGSVYPLTQSTGGGMSPISLGGGSGGGMPESISIHLNIDGQTFWSATGMSLAQSARAQSGMRGY